MSIGIYNLNKNGILLNVCVRLSIFKNKLILSVFLYKGKIINVFIKKSGALMFLNAWFFSTYQNLLFG